MRPWVFITLLLCRAACAADGDSIPLSGRNYLDLVSAGSEATRGKASSLHSAGQRGQNNNFLIDRVDNNDAWQRGAVLEPSLEAIETVNLAAPFIPAELGHGTGAGIDVRTRAGTSQAHGSAFSYHQNSVANARNFFDGAGKPGLLLNQFGGSLGGPLRNNGWFLFVNSEISRRRRGLTVVSTVPTAAQKSGVFGLVPIYDPITINEYRPVEFERQPFPGNRVPAGRIPSQAWDLIALYPDPNLPGLGDNYRFTPDQFRNSARFDVRSDTTLTVAHKLFSRFSYEGRLARTPGGLPGVADSDIRMKAWSGVLALTSTLRPTLVNELRGGVTSFDMTGSASDSRPVVKPTGYAQLGADGPVPFDIQPAAYQVEDVLQWTTGRHAWKFGFQVIRRHVDGTASEWTSRGTYLFTPDYTSQVGLGSTGNAIASLLTGYPSEFRRDIQYQPFRLSGWEWSAFAQDDFRLGRRLSVQAGVRYSLYPPPTEADNRMVNFNYSREAPALDQFAGQSGVNLYGGPGYKKFAIAPRVGFALDLRGNGATVLRGAFSQSYDTGAYIGQGSLARNPPFAARQDIFAGSLQLGLNLAYGLPEPQRGALLDFASLNAARGSIYAIEPSEYTPYSDQWALLVQQRLRPGLSLEIGGLGSMGMHLYASLDANQPYPTPSPYQWRRYPYEPYISRIEYLGLGAGSTYYGGEVKLAGQWSDDLRLQVRYRFAKSLDDATAPSTDDESRPPGAQYIYNQRSTRSLSSFDVAHRMVLTAFYDLADWRFSSLVTLQTGRPFTPQLAVNGLNNGGFWLPDRVGEGSLPPDRRSHLQWFDSGAFKTPPLYQYGNSGFNILRAPGLATVDAAVSREFALSPVLRLRARLEGFNILNRVNLGMPNRILGVSSTAAINHTATAARNFQLGVRLEW